MPKTVRTWLCVIAGVFLVMYPADKGNTLTTESSLLKRGKKEMRNARFKDMNLLVKSQYPALDEKGFGGVTLKLHDDNYRRRRLLSNEDEPAKQTNKSFMTKDALFAQNFSFPDDIQELCPFADICQQKSLEEIKRPYTSCCRSCYCDENCGQRGDCCFTADGAYSPETENTTDCLKTAIPGWGGPILPIIKDYRVKDSCRSSEQTCKDKTSAPWGALFPGYSSRTKRIYYNRHCAACNNVDDFQSWKFYIMSESMDDTSNELLLEALGGNSYPIVFIPQNTDDVEKHECFKSAIKACNVTGLWQEYNPAIEEACHKFQAPVYHRRFNGVFNNIYCIICNGKADDYTERCLPHPLYLRGGSETALSGLLDFTRISQTLSPVASASYGKDCPKHTVHHPYKAECRPILCPFGYTMTSSDCQLYIREWNKYGYVLRIGLLLEQGSLIPETDFKTLTEKELKNPKLWINTQGLPVDTFKLFGQIRQNTSGVSKFVVRIGGNQSPVKIDRVLQTIEIALSKIWTMKLKGFTYRLKAKLYRFRSYFESEDYKEIDVGNRKGKHYSHNGYIFISKMNFCKQVQLYNGEFVFLDGRSGGIQLNLTGDGLGKTLGDGERSDETAMSPLKICIEDFISNTQSARFIHIQGSPFTTDWYSCYRVVSSVVIINSRTTQHANIYSIPQNY